MACMKSINILQQLKNCHLSTRLLSTSSRALCQTRDVTHTGQVFEPEDYRNARFQNAARIVNPNWGIKLIEEQPIIESTQRVVSCNGGGGPLGHPKVYINLDKPGAHSCGYCGLRFQKKDHHH
ncbi:NADH dehydrogenase [ubiquinone] iron-sulfur protein 6, mitochondrial [Culicoides brevitarsis]|uniref:NADH dehydrogenase [ubiquinone] iron-sulfur protein 6, mitochondrial n=1 Tax=Culicoides brevitarsis TaxID=469753 RepID=UPI00307CAE67